MGDADAAVLDLPGLARLVTHLAGDGYRVIGPTRRDNAIVLAELAGADDLPAGWGVDVGPGHYRLRRRSDGALFGHSAGPQSWKQFLHPAHRVLWSESDGVTRVPDDVPRYAFLGVRGCDLAAIRKLDAVLMAGAHPDGSYARRRRAVFIVAANCTEPGGVCFCASMGCGPGAGPGYDLALTEQIDDAGHRFVVDVGSAGGQAVLEAVGCATATADDVMRARTAVADAAGRMGRAMPDTDLHALLRDNRESPHWADVAQRCLTCGNCTAVCPTCFCTTVEDTTDLTGEHAERAQRWASCFDLDFSYLHGGSVRPSGAGRYRQWMSHKLGTWHDQFGESGCVGCGRCIAWCPVGIDITEEAARLANPVDGGDGHAAG